MRVMVCSVSLSLGFLFVAVAQEGRDKTLRVRSMGSRTASKVTGASSTPAPQEHLLNEKLAWSKREHARAAEHAKSYQKSEADAAEKAFTQSQKLYEQKEKREVLTRTKIQADLKLKQLSQKTLEMLGVIKQTLRHLGGDGLGNERITWQEEATVMDRDAAMAKVARDSEAREIFNLQAVLDKQKLVKVVEENLRALTARKADEETVRWVRSLVKRLSDEEKELHDRALVARRANEQVQRMVHQTTIMQQVHDEDFQRMLAEERRVRYKRDKERLQQAANSAVNTTTQVEAINAAPETVYNETEMADLLDAEITVVEGLANDFTRQASSKHMKWEQAKDLQKMWVEELRRGGDRSFVKEARAEEAHSKEEVARLATEERQFRLQAKMAQQSIEALKSGKGLLAAPKSEAQDHAAKLRFEKAKNKNLYDLTAARAALKAHTLQMQLDGKVTFLKKMRQKFVNLRGKKGREKDVSDALEQVTKLENEEKNLRSQVAQSFREKKAAILSGGQVPEDLHVQHDDKLIKLERLSTMEGAVDERDRLIEKEGEIAREREAAEGELRAVVAAGMTDSAVLQAAFTQLVHVAKQEGQLFAEVDEAKKAITAVLHGREEEVKNRGGDAHLGHQALVKKMRETWEQRKALEAAIDEAESNQTVFGLFANRIDAELQNMEGVVRKITISGDGDTTPCQLAAGMISRMALTQAYLQSQVLKAEEENEKRVKSLQNLIPGYTKGQALPKELDGFQGNSASQGGGRAAQAHMETEVATYLSEKMQELASTVEEMSNMKERAMQLRSQIESTQVLQDSLRKSHDNSLQQAQEFAKKMKHAQLKSVEKAAELDGRVPKAFSKI